MEPLTHPFVDAIRAGDLPALRALLAADPGLARARFGTRRESRSALHVLADFPGHRPSGPETVRVLVAAGADVDARFHGAHTETPLHWAASNDDVPLLDALLDAGADIDAPGAVIAGGTPLADARAFGQWAAAARLVERGARVDADDAATLGLTDHVRAVLATDPDADTRGRLLWQACHGGRTDTALLLLDAGAPVDHVPEWEPLTPLDAAERAGAHDLAAELRQRGGHRAAERR